MSTVINRDEWMAALSEAGMSIVEEHPDAVTIQEFAGMIGMGISAAARRLRKMVKAGKAVECRKLTSAIDGRRAIHVAFKLVK